MVLYESRIYCFYLKYKKLIRLDFWNDMGYCLKTLCIILSTINLKNNSMKSNFVFVVEKIASTENEVVVAGRIKKGELVKGDVLQLVNRCKRIWSVTCERLERECHEIVRARESQSVTIWLSGVEKQNLEVGMYLTTPGYMVRF